MNVKKVLPIILFVFLAILAIGIKRCNNKSATNARTSQATQQKQPGSTTTSATDRRGLDRNPTKIFFTKHAKCRMQCRHISQQEVKDILATGTINYNKSDLNDPQGPTYALEGITKDRQHVRIIFAPKQQHMSVVTVIDLDNDYQCDC